MLRTNVADNAIVIPLLQCGKAESHQLHTDGHSSECFQLDCTVVLQCKSGFPTVGSLANRGSIRSRVASSPKQPFPSETYCCAVKQILLYFTAHLFARWSASGAEVTSHARLVTFFQAFLVTGRQQKLVGKKRFLGLKEQKRRLLQNICSRTALA